MTPTEFVAKWRSVSFGEKQASQEMFLDVCALVGHKTPVAYRNPAAFTFEKWVPGGFADAYLEGRFGWEFKGDDADLDAAMNQLLRYQLYLKTPPLLIVSSFRTIRIQTNFPGMETVRHTIQVPELEQPEKLDLLRRAFHAPDGFRPNQSRDDVTKETAQLLGRIVEDIESGSVNPERLARYLNQIIFCLYAEDAGLLPNSLFTRIVQEYNRDPQTFDQAVRGLFGQMAEGGLFGVDRVSYFNGDLFSAANTVEFSDTALLRLYDAVQRDWRNIEPSIFGTLFERALDASKRSQLGAHYTGAADIELVVEPVVMAPLRREWHAAKQEADALIAGGDGAAARETLQAFQRRLASVTVLDPACGSGNFLYIALRSLLDLEKLVIDFNDAQGWDEMYPAVKPGQMLGLEINPYAAELARTALWIGYIQWHQTNGIHYRQTPILAPMDTIRQTDAILSGGNTANPSETEWPAAEFIIGNPPFLGGKMMRRNLGDELVTAIFNVYSGRVRNSADLCCYWFEKARNQIATGKAKRAGLLATQGIRGGVNRQVLQRIKESGDIFMAYQDREWMLNGAMVHISIVGFDDGSETERTLNGVSCAGQISPALRADVDLTNFRALQENAGIAFQGFNRVGDFDVSQTEAEEMLTAPNPHGKPNSDVLKPYRNARDLMHHPRGVYTVDFGVDMTFEEAALYELPFEYVRARVLPARTQNKIQRARENWWLYQLPSIELRNALTSTNRYLATGRVSKHRIFTWLDSSIMPDNALVVFASDDDYFFGILHSRVHELWARAMGTQLREAESGFRYTPTTCFETFPFPEADEAQRAAIAEAAVRLNELRDGWLNPSGVPEPQLKNRTLTGLYNRRPTWLDNAHNALDAAVAAAYGWPADTSDAAILERLLSLNLSRSK